MPSRYDPASALPLRVPPALRAALDALAARLPEPLELPRNAVAAAALARGVAMLGQELERDPLAVHRALAGQEPAPAPTASATGGSSAAALANAPNTPGARSAPTAPAPAPATTSTAPATSSTPQRRRSSTATAPAAPSTAPATTSAPGQLALIDDGQSSDDGQGGDDERVLQLRLDLEAARARHGLSGRALASRVGTSDMSLRRFLSGTTTSWPRWGDQARAWLSAGAGQ